MISITADNDNNLGNGCSKFVLIVALFMMAIGLIKSCHSCDNQHQQVDITEEELENKVISDSIVELNAKEYEEAVQIKNLDNDSTLKLFYHYIHSN